MPDVWYMTNAGERVSHRRGRRRWLRAGLTATVLATSVAAQAPPAHAGLIGGLLGTTVGLVDGVLGILTPGWDDGATTPPVKMSVVNDAIGADDVWASGYDGSGVDIAVIDTGMVPVKGLDSPGKVVSGPDLSFESQSPDLRNLDGYGHGTHMAGIIAGNDGAGGTFRGVAPGARLIDMRVGSHDGAVDVTQVIAAIDWVVQHRNDPGFNIRVLNLSYGTDGTQDPRLDPLAHAVENAWRAGIVVVTGGGNDGTDRPMLVNPANNPYVLAVGAVDTKNTASVSDDKIAPFSSRGSSSRYVDVSAPGVSLASLRNPGSLIDQEHPGAVVEERFFRGSGTSQATAVTAGAVALLLDARPTLRPDEVKALLKSSASRLYEDSTRAQGAGRINVAKAVRSSVPFGATQAWTASSGTGSIDKSRGTGRVADDGVELVGETDIMGKPWNAANWAQLARSGNAWTDGSWNGSVWSGACWCSTTWAGTGWGSATWTGTSWTGRAWIGRAWIGRAWIGRAWIGDEWNGRAWIGRAWIGRAWM